jgi:hypothetical protein
MFGRFLNYEPWEREGGSNIWTNSLPTQFTVRVSDPCFAMGYRVGRLWLQPIARYGSIGSEVDFLESDPDPKFTAISEHVTPKVPGELFFYFNDAVVGLPRSFQWFYGDNKGCATLFVKPSK